MIPTTRRSFIRLAAGAPFLAVATPARAEPATIGRLIAQAQGLPRVAQRIAFISHALRGRPYQANTLIGGPGRPERFVMRDDAFDCVTFCEVVLAASLSRDLAGFEAALRRIRYENGRVSWQERNHYFAEWIRRAVENGIGRPVPIEPAVRIDRTVDHGGLGRRRVSIHAVTRQTLAANRHRLATGDIIGFVARRRNLDFFHTGLVTFGSNGEWLLRHASQSRGRILDEPMDGFLDDNRVQHVALLRAIDTASVAERL